MTNAGLQVSGYDSYLEGRPAQKGRKLLTLNVHVQFLQVSCNIDEGVSDRLPYEILTFAQSATSIH